MSNKRLSKIARPRPRPLTLEERVVVEAVEAQHREIRAAEARGLLRRHATRQNGSR